MSPNAIAVSEKIMQLSEEQLAEVETFVESLRVRDFQPGGRVSMSVSERAFEAVWSNPEDDVYDAL